MKELLRKSSFARKSVLKEKLHFAAELRRLMDARGLKNQQLGAAIGLSHVAIGKYLDGTSLPKAEYLLAFARFFDVSMESLLGVEEMQRRSDHRAELSAMVAEDAARIETGWEGIIGPKTRPIDPGGGAAAVMRQAAAKLRTTAAAMLSAADDLESQAETAPERASRRQYQSQIQTSRTTEDPPS